MRNFLNKRNRSRSQPPSSNQLFSDGFPGAQAFFQLCRRAAWLEINLDLRRSSQLPSQLVERSTLQSVLGNHQLAPNLPVRTGDQEILQWFSIGNTQKGLGPRTFPPNVSSHKLFHFHAPTSKLVDPKGIRPGLRPRSPAQRKDDGVRGHQLIFFPSLENQVVRTA